MTIVLAMPMEATNRASPPTEPSIVCNTTMALLIMSNIVLSD